MQITVVATGFDDKRVKEDPFRKLSRLSSANAPALAIGENDDRFRSAPISRDTRETREINMVRESRELWREEPAPQPAPAPQPPVPTEPVSQKARSDEEETPRLRDEIAFPARKLEPRLIIEEKIQPQGAIRGEFKEDFKEEDDLEIPAFIRRKMKK